MRVYTDPTSIYCIWPSVEGATIIPAQDIWFVQSIHELYIKGHLVCDILYTSSQWMDVNPQSWDTTVLLQGHCSNSMVGLVYMSSEGSASLFVCLFVF